jgi:dihydroxyacetone kinase-like protein
LTNMEQSGLTTTTRVVIAVADALEGASEQLCELDAVAGDGDHGLAMAGASRNIRSKLTEEPPTDVSALLGLVGDEFALVGGAMGAIIYVLLQAVGQAAVETRGELSALDISRLLSVAQDAVSEFGGGQPGDKTVIDAIASAREAASDSARLGASAAETLLAAAEGARKGAEATAGMVARIGRASRLGELSRGKVDPGARSFAISMEAVATTYARETSQK